MANKRLYVCTFPAHYLGGVAIVRAIDQYSARNITIKQGQEHGLNLTAGDIEAKPVTKGDPVIYFDNGDY